MVLSPKSSEDFYGSDRWQAVASGGHKEVKKERAKKRIKREGPYPFSIKPKSFLPTLHRVSGMCVCVCVCEEVLSGSFLKTKIIHLTPMQPRSMLSF